VHVLGKEDGGNRQPWSGGCFLGHSLSFRTPDRVCRKTPPNGMHENKVRSEKLMVC
jgi:hypothetical protein